MRGLQLGGVSAPKPCELPMAYSGASKAARVPASSWLASRKATQVEAAAGHQQHAQINGSLHMSSSNGASSNGASSSSGNGQGTPVLSATWLLEWSAAAARPAAPDSPHEDVETSSSSSSSHHRIRPGSSSSSSMDAAPHNGSWDLLQHLPALAADAHEAATAAPPSLLLAAPCGQAADAQLTGSSGRPSTGLSSSSSSSSNSSNSSSSEGQHSLSDAAHHLMVTIMQQTGCWQDLAQLLESQSHQFGVQHCAAALYRLASLWQQQQQQAQQQQELRAQLQLQRPVVLQLAAVLLRGMRQQMGEARGRDVADAVCAAVKLGVELPLSPAAVQASAAAGSAAAAAAAGSAAAAAAAGLHAGSHIRKRGGSRRQGPAAAGQLSGVAESLLQHSAALMRTGGLKALPLSRLLWGITHLGLQPSQDWWAAALEATAMQLKVTQLQQLQRLEHSYSSQSLSLVGWAVAKLQAPATAAWWGCYAAAAGRLLPQMQPGHLSRCMWALATARQAPDAAWMDAFYAASGSCMQQFNPQGLAVMLWALAVLQQQPPQQWLQQHEAASAGCLYGYSMQHLSMTLWALGSLSRAAANSGSWDGSSSSTSSSSSTWSAGPTPLQQHRQQQHQQQQHHHQQQQTQPLALAPSAAWLKQAWSQLSLVESEATAQGLACVLWSLLQLRVAVPEARLQQLEALVGPVLRDAEPQGLAVIVWALGLLRGPAARRALVQRIRRHCQQHPHLLTSQLSGQGLFMLLHGMARFNAWQPDSFKQQLLAAVTTRLQHGLRQIRVTAEATASSSSAHSGGRSCSDRSGGARGFKSQELPVVLLSLTQLQIVLPTQLLHQCETLLLPQLAGLPLHQLAICLFALGRARHNPSAAFLDAALVCVDGRLAQCGPKDVAHVLYGMATMGGVREQLLAQPQQQAQVARLLARAQQVVPLMDHSCLAMSMWAMARLPLRPSDPLLQACLAATTAQLPAMSLISITTILAGYRSLEYLPPLAWMVDTCSAARSIYNSDNSCKPWQRRNNLRRLEETVVWFNAMVQQHAEAGGAGAGSQSSRQQGPGGRGQGQGRARRGPSMLGVSTAGSEAMLAAAVGVAAAVAQQWHP